MKKINFLFLLGALVLFATGCTRDDEITQGEVKTIDKFIINTPAFTPSNSDSKAYFDSLDNRILYDEGDIVYVNGVPFELSYEGDHWEATGTSVTSDIFYMAHANGAVSNFSSPTYQVDIRNNGEVTATNGIVLYGSTTSNVLTLNPSVAILAFWPSDMSKYSGMKVGFDGNKIPSNFNISAANGSISVTEYISQASSSYERYTMLRMKKDITDSYFYVAIPIAGSSVTTKLYLTYNLSNGSNVQRITSGTVTLQKGKVYVLPTEGLDDYPFDEYGRSKSTFSISATKHVKFSAGNLQCNPAYFTANSGKIWVIAHNQYDCLSNTYNENINSTTNHYIDVFGWATTGYEQYVDSIGDIIPHYPYQTDEIYSYYYAGTAITNLSGNAVYDWGRYTSRNNIIYYGESQSALPSAQRWRTLSQDEWTYLLNGRANATSKRGYATIGSVRGFVILPDSWTQPTGVTFTPNGPNNNYTLQQWAKMEKAGAIFLPASGVRTHANNVEGWNTEGYYWTGTYRNNTRCWAIQFENNGTTCSLDLDASGPRYNGMSVRLVSPID